MLSRALTVPFIVAAAGVLLAGCSAPAPNPGGGGSDDPPAPVVDLPGWYGTDLDSDGCPIPVGDAALERFAGAGDFLQAEVPDGWCVYSSTDYTEYVAIPVPPVDDFGADVRAALEPAGWEFDAADDDSPQWSWINAFPPGSETDFEDGAVDGAIFTVGSATQDDIDTYSIWFGTLPTAFGGAWSVGDEISVLGFW
jgi:hypothetical protein